VPLKIWLFLNSRSPPLVSIAPSLILLLCLHLGYNFQAFTANHRVDIMELLINRSKQHDWTIYLHKRHKYISNNNAYFKEFKTQMVKHNGKVKSTKYASDVYVNFRICQTSIYIWTSRSQFSADNGQFSADHGVPALNLEYRLCIFFSTWHWTISDEITANFNKM
jgi:hypothetical protein